MKHKPAPRNAFYAQSGGVTAVINASACGVIETARKHKDTHRQGVRRPQRHHRRAHRGPDRHQPGKRRRHPRAAPHAVGRVRLGRYKLKKYEDNPAQYERLIEVFKAHDIGYFFYNGGGDSADTCLKVSQLAEKLGYPMQAIHVPKTVDNDLPITDCCPGFGSVAKYVAVSIREAGLRRGLDGAHLDQGVRAGSDGPPRRLDRRRRRARGRKGRRCAAHHPVPGNRLRRRRSSSPA